MCWSNQECIDVGSSGTSNDEGFYRQRSNLRNEYSFASNAFSRLVHILMRCGPECVTRVTRQFIAAPLMPSEDFHAVASLGVSISERRWSTSTQVVPASDCASDFCHLFPNVQLSPELEP